MITYIKTAFTKPNEIYIARNMKNRHFFYHILLVTLAMTILSLFQYVPLLKTIGEDLNEIKSSVPSFELVQNQMESDSQSYIYQTDSMIFYFDSENKINRNTIDDNMIRVTAPASVGILKSGLYVNIIGQGYYLPYTDIQNLTTSGLKSLITNLGNLTLSTYLLMIIILFIIQFVTFLYWLLPIALFANVLSVISGVHLKFLQNLKITLLAVIPPTLILTLIQTFIMPIHFDFEVILVMSLLIYYMSIKEMKTRLMGHI